MLLRAGVDAKLHKVEASRTMPDIRDSCLFLSLEGALEFWAHVSKRAGVNLKTGKIAVVL